MIDEHERKRFDKAVTDRKDLIRDIYLMHGKTLTSSMLDSEIDKILHHEKYATPKHSFFELYDKFIADNSVSENTLKKRRTVMDALKRFEQCCKIILDINTVASDTLQSLDGFLRNENKYSKEQPA